MDIQKEIKQTVKFQSEYHKMAVNILFTASWLNLHHTQKLKKFDLTPQQFNILRILRGQHPEPATINLLIERMIDKSSNSSRLVDRLFQKGFVLRCVNEADKRAVNVRISDKGMNVLKQIDDQTNYLEMDLQTLSEKEARQLNNLLDKLRG
ncbi:MAG TPA: MarR family transcriptional regulator [Bacteroidia bacterium]|nr:MarR family transcriptional regulator [Bacteroidia bacterium]